MNMPQQIQKNIARSLLIAWVFLWGHCLFEAFGYLRGTPEQADQSIEQILTAPADRVQNHLGELLQKSPEPQFIGNAAPALPPPAEVLGLPVPFSSESPPLVAEPRLFQRFSNYRI